jgi:ribosomal protein S6--L-glutamate ligase
MQLASFDIFRTLGLPNTTNFKPESFLQHRAELQAADWVLFPEYWQLNALIYGLHCRVFPSQASYLIGHNKTEMVRAFTASVPQHTPHTLIRANDESNREWVWREMDAPFVAKLTRSSMGQGVWLIESPGDWRRYCAIADVLYVQEYLPIDRDLRIVVIGNEVVDSYWRLQAARGFYNNVAQGGTVDRDIPVPESALQLVRQVARTLGINHAGFDVAMVGNHPYLLEFNRRFGTQGVAGGQGAIRNFIWNYLQEELEPPKPKRPGIGRRLPRAA